MDNTEDTAWVFDSLIGFLHGPIWNSPLQTFIEEKSLIFEPTDDGQIVNREEYAVVHGEYKNLVDLMLGSYMDDIGITPEQFEAACQMSKHNVEGLPRHFHQRLFEQIWAANDYPIFTKMMTQRNVELQLQALELIEQQSGMVPNSFKRNDESQEDVIMEQVKKLSMEDTHDEPVELSVIENIETERINLRTALENFQNDAVEDEKTPIEPETIVRVKPPQEDIAKRQLYLKQQRDKLLMLKRQIREKQLESTEGVEAAPRPKSAKTAKFLLSGESVETSTAQDTSLQLRKALAERLRSQVVEKS